jgi:hypothetical protein
MRKRCGDAASRLGRSGRAAEEVRITRKTLLELPEPVPPASSPPKLPDHPAYRQIMAVFAAADTPLRRTPARPGRHRSHDKRQGCSTGELACDTPAQIGGQQDSTPTGET